MTDHDSQDCKMFVGGLSPETDETSLKEYFSKWGEVTDSVVMKDSVTKRPRGFGFVTYSNPQSVDDCLADKPYILDDKAVEVKRAVPREDSKEINAHQKTKKVFLGGISPDTTKEDIIDVLKIHGNVMDVQIMTDKNNDRPRGFAFAVMEDCDVVDKLCIKKYHKIRDRDVEVKKAISQDEMRKMEVPRGRQSDPYSGYYQSSGRDSYRGGSTPYGRSTMYDSAYRVPPGYGYDYRFPDHMRSTSDYYGYGDRGPVAASAGYNAAGYGAYRYPSGYDMGYSQMYAQPSAMGSYNQSASSYGPSRGSYATGPADPNFRGDKDRGGTKYHPYRR